MAVTKTANIKKNQKNSKLSSIIKKEDKIPVSINTETSQASVPIYSVHEKYGIIESYPGCYVKSYLIGDNNYLTAPDEEQEVDYTGWRKLLNSFGPEVDFQLTINNKSINMQEFCDGILIKEVGDKHDYLRKEFNNIVLNRVSEGKNGITKEKYLTVGIHTSSVKKAYDTFQRLDRDIDKSLQKIASNAKALSLEECLEVLYSIYNDDENHLIQKQRITDDTGRVSESKTFDYDNMRSMGLSINDFLAPSSFVVDKKCIHLGNKLARVLKVTQLPSRLMDEFLTNVTDMNFNCITTVNYKPIPPKKAEALVAKNLSFTRDEKQRAMKAGQKAGIYDDSYVDPNVLEREAEALSLRDRMHENDEKLFETSITVIVFAYNEKQLDEFTETIITEYKKASVTISPMSSQQEEGFNSTLPLCYNQITERRTLTSSSAAILIPFSTLEVMDEGGINYSCNLLSKNLIVYDRLSSSNFNGFILGTPGSGKSFTAKTEMLNVFLKSNSDIIVIDPEDEYGPLAKMLGGEVIKVVPGGDVHINPLEIVNDYEMDDESNPVNAKADFILKVMECILDSPFGIDSVQQTIIDECVHALFAPFVVKGKLRDVPPEKMPTLTDLQILLGKRSEPEARQLSMALKLYSGSGSLNAFGFRTNVHTTKRFVVYQIRDIGDRLKPLAMLTILDHVWNKIVENRKVGKNTWFYVDEIYLLFQQAYSSSFLNQLFRRARKYGGVPTGMTQNISTMLENPDARDMLQNCNFIQIQNQAGKDREKLQELLNVSDQLISYICNAPRGQGLLYLGARGIVPFYSQMPKNTEIYRALTSDMKEIKMFEEQAKREQSRMDKENKGIQ